MHSDSLDWSLKEIKRFIYKWQVHLGDHIHNLFRFSFWVRSYEAVQLLPKDSHFVLHLGWCYSGGNDLLVPASCLIVKFWKVHYRLTKWFSNLL